jgi:hypothetical protein
MFILYAIISSPWLHAPMYFFLEISASLT